MAYRTAASQRQSPPASSMVIPVTTRRKFFDRIVRQSRSALPGDLQRFSHSGTFNLMKVWYDYQRVHYEIVIDQQINRIEIGLHFEDGPASTLAYLAILDAQILELKEKLGVGVELERWTQSWGRIYELHPLSEINDRIATFCASRLTEFITTLQPIMASSGVRHDRE